ncbi:MAG: MBL fold metallo-hydrolase [Anaerolineales bacterium]|nr:MBL fold metallo-hydrolase [Anaerolineales bacterium]
MLEIVSCTLGPAVTNAYLIADSETKEAAVIDPAWDGHIILKAAQDRNWRIGHLWYTHAHFDHIGGAAAIADSLNPLPHVALHPDDHVLWRAGGGGAAFGLNIDPGPEPTIDLVHGMTLKLGSNEFEVRFTPGHTRGHCVLYVKKENICFCGDLIFNESVGRTDFPGGDFPTLEKSIREQIFVMPNETRLLSGHGPETTVGHEKQFNPFVGEQ